MKPWRLIFWIVLLASISLPDTSFALNFAVGGLRLRKDVKSMREIRRENVVSQSLDISCGPAGLATLFNYYLNEPVSEVEIISTLLRSIPLEKVRARKGFSLLDLKKFAQAKGYKVIGYKMDIGYLRDFNKPVLVPIRFKNYRHFVVVRGIVADRVFIADPTAGNISMKLAKFTGMWIDGVGLVIENPHKSFAYSNALRIKQRDSVIINYKSIGQFVNQAAIRTTIYPGEF